MDEKGAFRGNGPQRNPRRTPQKRTRPISFLELKTMLKDKTASEVLQRISREDESLQRLLNDTTQDTKNTRLIVQVLSKALDNSNVAQPEGVNDVVQTFLNSNSFIEILETQVLDDLGYDTLSLTALLYVMKIALQKLPNKAPRVLSYLEKVLERIVTERYAGNAGVQSLFTNVSTLMQVPLRRVEEEQREQHRQEILQHDADVDPDLFRGLSIIPTAADFDPEQDIQLRANKVIGGYDNVNDYLDIQFRLLRADLILPLRKNILEFQGHGGEQYRHHFKGMRVYSQVRIVRPVCHDVGLSFRLSFDVSKLRVKWAVSQRLKYGSLLCLSNDNFATYRCAVVEKREAKDLALGLVDVQFIVGGHGANGNAARQEEFMRLLEESRNCRYVMVESPSYFEAYKYVLQGLQNITEESFPFWPYIGRCRPMVGPPRYLQERGADVTYDLRPLVDNDYIIEENNDEVHTFSREAQLVAAVKVQDFDSWPHSNVFNLDFSQFAALQSAFTREFSVIQGPPGTGKTYIGLKVLKALLHNKHVWTDEEGQSNPILLVCYTNHALDQFLEGILKFFKGKLVRVGSRSKSEVLEEYNLRSFRNRARENRTVPMEIHLGKMEVRLKMKELKADIHKEAAKLEILEREIVTESFLKEFIHEEHFDQLTRKTERGKSVIPRWLGMSDYDKENEERYWQEWRQRLQMGAVGEHVHRQIQGQAGHGQGAMVQPENEEDEEYLDIDLFGEVDAEVQRMQSVDVDDSDSDQDEIFEDTDLFDELLNGLGNDHFEKVRQVNKKLDDVDVFTELIRNKNIAFNISDYGDEEMPRNLKKEEKKHWRDIAQMKKQYKQILLGHLQKTDMVDEEEALQIYNPWRIRRSDRWRLYRYWVDIYCRQLRVEIRDKSQEFERLARRYQEILHQEDKAILEKATVIGMTSTTAARYQAVLREIGTKIVIVEEAAEVLEGHVVTSLSAESQHVILIGDHKQLRPNPSVHKLKTDYGFDISLFERLVNNGFPFDCLKYQHRMRPEISQLLRVKDLYPDLLDHESVKTFEHVSRLERDVHFIHHDFMESQEEDTKTYCNGYEARYLAELLLYLLHQGYCSKQITILSPYAGQVHLIKKVVEEVTPTKAMGLRVKGLKVISVDNYQGEENDIVLLSMVRSNPNDDIGFLKMNNRICVALSRAKVGLFVIGNFLGLSKSSTMFQEILAIARQQELIGPLVHYCLHHRQQKTTINGPDDFEKVPEGGCQLPCSIRLDCGHKCPRVCHTDDPEHKHVKCTEQCGVFCEKCQKTCPGGHQCGRHTMCQNLVQKRIPNCGHDQLVPCYMEVNQFECKGKCKQLLPCRHLCGRQCGSPHLHSGNACSILVKVRPEHCGHESFDLECRKARGEVTLECPKACGAVLECGHLCSGTCGRCQNGRLHVNCEEPCPKILICGHACRAKCSDCPPCTLPCENACCHSKCPKACGAPCASCLEPCMWRCEHAGCQEQCCQPCERPPCNMRCKKILQCRHRCCGLCGEKCPRLCVICHKQELIDTSLLGYDGDPDTLFIELDCGHVLEVDFVDQWMVTSTSSSEEESDQLAIAMKACPLCKSVIRKCPRYNKQIKEILRLIERVKRKYIGDNERLDRLKRQRDDIARTLGGQDGLAVDKFIADGGKLLSLTILEAQINQIRLFQQLCALTRKADEGQIKWGGGERADTFRAIISDLQNFKAWTLQKRSLFSPQNNLDARREHGRLSILLDLRRLEFTIEDYGVHSQIPVRLMILLGQSLGKLKRYGAATDKDIDESRQLCEDLRKSVPESNIALTSAEKLEIVKAMGLTKGAWYKCLKGHIYAIGECGQAMEESRCPECKSTIGGRDHRLNASNAWAPEMDNAEVPISRNFEADHALAQMMQRQLNDQFGDV